MDDPDHGPTGGSLSPSERVAARFERRIRLLAAARVPPERLEKVVAGVLAEATRCLEGGVYEPGAELADAVYALARRPIASVGQGETFDPMALLVQWEERDEVVRCLERLDEPDRALLRELFLEGRSPAEIARRDGLTPDDVQRSKRRAIERFLEARRSPPKA